jgi:hypothetical protein
MQIFIKSTLAQQFSVNIYFAERHENPADGLVADTKSHNGLMDGRGSHISVIFFTS